MFTFGSKNPNNMLESEYVYKNQISALDEEGPNSSRAFHDDTSVHNASSVTENSMASFKKNVPSKYYSDIQMIGKHYLMWKKDGIKRHYTISNCMEPKVYSEYIRVMKEYNENRWNSEIKFNKKFFECD